MSKYDFNAGADAGSYTVSLNGAAYLDELDPNTDKPSGISFSMGHNTAMSLNISKEFKELSHTLFQKRAVTDTIETASTVEGTLTMQNFAPGFISKLMNSKVTQKAGELQTIVVDVTEDHIKEGFNVQTDQATGTVIVTDSNADELVEGVHFVINNGGIYFLPKVEQEALVTSGQDVMEAGEVTIKNTGLSSEVIEYDTESPKFYQLTLCLFDGLDAEKMIKFVFHKVKINNESLPLKEDNDDEISYDVAFTALVSKYIKDPKKSKLFTRTDSYLKV